MGKATGRRHCVDVKAKPAASRVDERLFEELVRHIRAHGRQWRFCQKALVHYEEDGKVYRTMSAPIEETTIVDRCESEDPCERRLVNGPLP